MSYSWLLHLDIALCGKFSASSKHGLILLAIISHLFLDCRYHNLDDPIFYNHSSEEDTGLLFCLAWLANCPSDEAGGGNEVRVANEVGAGKMQIGNNFLHLIPSRRPQSPLFHLLCKHIEQLFRRIHFFPSHPSSCQVSMEIPIFSSLLTAAARKGHNT